MNTPVSFELAKLLKEKGFNLKVINFYDYERLSTPFDKQRHLDGLINYNPINWNSIKDHYTSAPTIAEVVMWLYEKHGIWIYTRPMIENKNVIWRWVILNTHLKVTENTLWEKWDEPNFSNSPTEAYEAAIEYTLNNLI